MDFTNQIINGTVNNTNWIVPLLANRNVFSKTNKSTAYAGKYTFTVPGNTDGTLSPGGDGYGIITINTLGSITMSGRLADGTVISQGTTLSQGGLWPLFKSLYSGKGMMMSWVDFATGTNGVATNTVAPNSDSVAWFSPANPKAKYYKQGFTNQVPLVGSTYLYARGTPMIDLTNGVIVLGGGNLNATNTFGLTWGSNNLVKFDPTGVTNKARLTLSTSSGTVSGSFFDTDIRKTFSFKGVVLQNQSAASGYFLGTNQSGFFSVQNQ